MLLLIPLYLLGSMVAGYVGRNTRIGYWGFFFVSLMVTPVISLLFLFFAYPKKRKDYKTKIEFIEK
jgi:hypothetical protein